MSLAAQNACNIMDGRLTEAQMESLSTRYDRQAKIPDYEREWLSSLDPKPLIEMLENEPDEWNRNRIMRSLEHCAQYLIRRHPEIMGNFLETIIRVSHEYPPLEYRRKFDDPMEALQRWHVPYWSVDQRPAEEYHAYFDAYAKVLPAFAGEHEHWKTEEVLKQAMKHGYWRNFFLWLELLECPKGVGTEEYGSHGKSPFVQLSEAEIRYVADFCPKRSQSAKTVLSRYIDSKEELGENHAAVWDRISKALVRNPLAEGMIQDCLYFVHRLTETAIREMEFVADFGRRLAEPGPRRIVNGIKKLHLLAIDGKNMERLLDVLSSHKPWYIGYFAEIIHQHRDNLPTIERLSELLDTSEKLSDQHSYPLDDHVRIITDYLLRYSNQADAVVTLDRFLKTRPSPDSLGIVKILPKTYQSNWDTDPVYAAALDNRFQFVWASESAEGFIYYSTPLFVALCRAWLSIPECENVYAKISRSRDTYRSMGFFMDGHFEEKDIHTLAALLRFRGKNFHKFIQTIAPRADIRNLQKTFGQYMPEHRLWHIRSDAEIKVLQQGGYAQEIETACLDAGMDPLEYEKDIRSFERTVAMYPDFHRHSDKYAKAERAMFDVKFHAAYRHIALNYIKILDVPGLDPSFLESLDRDETFVLIQIIATSARNQNVGKELLLSAIGPDGATHFATSHPKNQEWLSEKLTDRQRDFWLSRNERTLAVTDKERKTDETALQEMRKFLRVVAELLVDTPYAGSIDLSSARGFIDSLPKFLKTNADFSPGLVADLELQSASLAKILQKTEERSVGQVRIYHEHDPLRALMMGDWVDSSCLASYSSVGNCWSAIANATETNKAVLYAEDEKGNIIGRVLLAINAQKQLVPFTVYRRGNVDVDLSRIFEKYLVDFANRMGMPFSDNAKSVERILDCDWYVDPVWKLPGIIQHQG